MYSFILNMWIMREIDEERVQSYEPKFIKQNQVNMILATPQGNHLDVQSVPNTRI